VKRHPPTLRLALLALLSVAASSCGGGLAQAKNPFAPASANETEVQVRVENQNFGDATVHVLRGGERIRLGNVTGKSDQNFTLRWNFSLPMEFQVEIIGGQGCAVRPLVVDPGDRVFVRIPTQLAAQACYSGKLR